MLQSVVKIVTICPTCRDRVEVEATSDETGILHPPVNLPTLVLVAHHECNLVGLIAEIARATFHASKVEVYRVRGGEDDV